MKITRSILVFPTFPNLLLFKNENIEILQKLKKREIIKQKFICIIQSCINIIIRSVCFRFRTGSNSSKHGPLHHKYYKSGKTSLWGNGNIKITAYIDSWIVDEDCQTLSQQGSYGIQKAPWRERISHHHMAVSLNFQIIFHVNIELL